MATTIEAMMASLEGKRNGPKVPPPRRAVEAKPAVAKPRQAPVRGSWGRSMRVRLPIEDEQWLLSVVGDALKSGTRVREVDVVRLAVRQLRESQRSKAKIVEQL